MDRRALLISLVSTAGLAACDLTQGPLAVITDPDLKDATLRALSDYRQGHAGVRWELATGSAIELYALAQADGARVLVTREIKLAENLRRTRRAPLENRWTLGTPDAPIAIVVTKGAGEGAAKAFAQWLSGPEGRGAFESAPTAP